MCGYHPFSIETKRPDDRQWEFEVEAIERKEVDINIVDYRMASACVTCSTIYRQESFTQRPASYSWTCCPACDCEALGRNLINQRIPRCGQED